MYLNMQNDLFAWHFDFDFVVYFGTLFPGCNFHLFCIDEIEIINLVAFVWSWPQSSGRLSPILCFVV